MATDALHELYLLENPQSSGPDVHAQSAKVPTGKLLEINTVRRDLPAEKPNKNVATTYIAPNKFNAAKRRRATLPEVSLKRIRPDTNNESSTRTADWSQFKLRQDTHQASTLSANMPTGPSKEAYNANVGRLHQANEIESVYSNQATICESDAPVLGARIEYEELLRRNSILRREHDEMIVRNAVLRQEQLSLKNTESEQFKTNKHKHPQGAESANRQSGNGGETKHQAGTCRPDMLMSCRQLEIQGEIDDLKSERAEILAASEVLRAEQREIVASNAVLRAEEGVFQNRLRELTTRELAVLAAEQNVERRMAELEAKEQELTAGEDSMK
ncbi:hypothetical protein EDC01DRAFT_630771 [Geopyxis carbonaria]|nr:hypothetical protein EDC01DRAFT_630771 [Geopyxis carbonaria]